MKSEFEANWIDEIGQVILGRESPYVVTNDVQI